MGRYQTGIKVSRLGLRAFRGLDESPQNTFYRCASKTWQVVNTVTPLWVHIIIDPRYGMKLAGFCLPSLSGARPFKDQILSHPLLVHNDFYPRRDWRVDHSWGLLWGSI